ncbi:hypothetical protein GCM10010358_41400 [Streptomyces minutiscleroticus]|uniref:Uncharacterized protein n=1 Tax=Streptomyces minutiscleroticus TaxID=68238 RepID=A0A918NNC3_9ACTN|nr:hypothetical protein GCM10010358_41400 [Streptomyces minutiscleroticus]
MGRLFPESLGHGAFRGNGDGAASRRAVAVRPTGPFGYTHVSSHIRDRQLSIGMAWPV